MKYYKFLTKNARGGYSKFDYTPYLPNNGKPGKWLPKIKGKLVECWVGYHACKQNQILNWLNDCMFEVEFEGKVNNYGDKIAGAKMRLIREMPGWNEKNQRLAACDIAESVLKNWENEYPKDKRPREAIETARRFANGKATDNELAAAESAAWSVARSARSAELAAWSAELAELAESAAWSVAWSARSAWSAARSAARSAAELAARSAAWSAARSAAWSVAWSAWSAARSVAESAAIKIIMRYANKK
jgi:hypothetical protein